MEAERPFLGAAFQPFAYRRISGRALRQPNQQSTQIQPGTAYKYWDASARGNLSQSDSRQSRKVAGGEMLPGRNYIDQMMRNTLPFRDRSLRGPDVEAAVDLQGIVIDDLPISLPCKMQREIAFSRACRPEHDEERL